MNKQIGGKTNHCNLLCVNQTPKIAGGLGRQAIKRILKKKNILAGF